MITAKLITDAYVFLRTNNHSIPDEVLDFMKDASLAALQSQNSIKLPVSRSAGCYKADKRSCAWDAGSNVTVCTKCGREVSYIDKEQTSVEQCFNG